MCGIVGYVGQRQVLPLLMEGLRRLEYRGYDSAGVAVVQDGVLAVAKKKGKVRELDGRPAGRGHPGDRRHRPHPLGHPRRAQRPQRPSAHRRGGRIGVVHNGIIENAAEWRPASSGLAARVNTCRARARRTP
jgi:glucosamine--fructose-6-phosphate aminotransferase (isomerizing)